MAEERKVQGEGDYESAKQYDKDQKKFVESGRVEEAARAAEPRSEKEKEEMAKAEEAGKRRAKEEDPAVHRSPDGKACDQ